MGLKVCMEISAGGIVFRKEGDGIKYLLLHYPAGHWDFPKGNVEKGETEKETVRREVREETGIKDIEFIEGFREVIEYFYRKGKELVHKKVYFHLLKTSETKVRLSFEHKGYKWLPYKEACEIITFRNSKDVLRKADRFLKSTLMSF
jgi:8-oxo-dGTP pyrophosphatase MutT (NUDIX family)